MVTFIFKVAGQNVDLATVGDPTLKNEFQRLQAQLSQQLGSVACTVHHHEPTVVLSAEGSTAKLDGFGGCCREFNNRVRSLLKNAGYPTDGWTSATLTTHVTM